MSRVVRTLAAAFVLPLASCGPIGEEGAERPRPVVPGSGGSGASGGTGSGGSAAGGSGGGSGTSGTAGQAAGVESVPPGPSDEDAGGGCEVGELPSYADLVENPKLPDPFLSLDGSRIETKDAWTCRRAEIKKALEVYELGPKPLRPVIVEGAFDQGAITVTAGDDEETISFTANITLPATGDAPYPAVIAIGGSSLPNQELAELGVALISFNNGEVGAQENLGSRGRGKFYDLYGANHQAGAMMAWAWGVSRLIDALELVPEASIDPERLAVTGCSRNGKGALVVGAFDERIRLVIPQESGSGGSASWRVSDWMMAGGTEVQTLSQIVTENCWFRDSFKQFGSTANRLPFDHHMLMGMVAPRGLLVLENTSQVWLGNVSTFTASAVAHRVWDALSVPDAMGVTQVGNATHCQFPTAQLPILTAYVEKFLLGDDEADTAVLETDGGYEVDEELWVDWDVPELE